MLVYVTRGCFEHAETSSAPSGCRPGAMRFAILGAGLGAHLVKVFRDGERGLNVGSLPRIALGVRVGADTPAFARGDGRGRPRFDRPGAHVVRRGEKRRVARRSSSDAATDPSHRDPRENPPTVAMSAARLPIPVRERTYTLHSSWFRASSDPTWRRRRCWRAFSRRARLGDDARRRAARPRGSARPGARFRETKRDASEAPIARDSSRTWRGRVCDASRNNGADVTSLERAPHRETRSPAPVADPPRRTLEVQAGDRAGRHSATSLIAGEDAAQGKEGQAGLAGLVQRR